MLNIYLFNFIDRRIRQWTILNDFYRWQINTYIQNISKEWKISFCSQGRLNHHKYLNLLYIYTIWLFTAFAQINIEQIIASHIEQIICLDTLLGNGISPSILDGKIKSIEAFQSRLMSTYIGGFLYSIIYSIASFFWLYFHTSVQHGDL